MKRGEPTFTFVFLSLSGGSDRENTVKGWRNLTGLDWAPDGKGLYCGSVSPQKSTLLYVDLKGNAKVMWQHKGGPGDEIWGVPSLDGHYLAIRGDATNSNGVDAGRLLSETFGVRQLAAALLRAHRVLIPNL